MSAARLVVLKAVRRYGAALIVGIGRQEAKASEVVAVGNRLATFHDLQNSKCLLH